MAKLMCVVVIMACFFSARSAFAAGGTCPTGANYTSLTNPTGALVTLASYGIKSCYFVSGAGSDSLYDGTSETVSGSHGPFLHSPGMENCSKNCASVTLSSGTGVIFRGGDTWHFGNSGATPYAGVVSTCADNGNNAAGLCLDDINATSSNPIYYGVDQTWYTGSSWARPIFTADNPPCNSGTTGTLPDGDTCTGTTDSYGQPSYYVSACGYQVGNSNNLVDVGYSKYIIVDNFEVTGLCQSHVGQPGGFDTFIQYSSAQAPLYLTNNYIHGATHLPYAAKNGSTGCTGTTVCINLNAFGGSVSSGSVGETLAFNVVDFSDSDPGGENLTQAGFYNVAYNVFRYVTQALPSTLHIFHDNLYEYFFENGHSNMIESADTAGTNAIYNNVFRHVETYVTSGGGVALWFGPVATTTTDYIFNNLVYDVGALEYLNIGGTGLTVNQGNYVFLNNTFQSNTAQSILNCNLQTAGTTTDTNNHYIDNQRPYLSCPSLTTKTSLCQSNTSGGTGTACATYSGSNSSPKFDQYTSSEAYAYSPVASTNSTVGAGTNEQSYCSALLTAASSDSTLSNAALACQNDLPYSCGYVVSTHSVSCQASTSVVPRPASAKWDIGAYQYPANAPNTPTNPAAVVVP